MGCINAETCNLSAYLINTDSSKNSGFEQLHLFLRVDINDFHHF